MQKTRENKILLGEEYKPFTEIQKSGQKANIYEWENKENVRFRVVINNVADMDSNPTTATKEIITFYSDRNLKEPMTFKNQKLKQSSDTLSDLSAQNQKLEQEKQWLNTFNLKSLDEDFIPQIEPQAKEVLEKVGVNDIHLKRGSFEKLVHRDRIEFLDKIKPTLETPNAIVKQNDGALIFVKDFGEVKYFSSVAKDDKGQWVVTSNAPKTLNNLQNKIKEGGEILYSDLPELPIIAKPELSAKALNSEANHTDIIQAFIQQGSKQKNSKLWLPRNEEVPSLKSESPKSELGKQVAKSKEESGESLTPLETSDGIIPKPSASLQPRAQEDLKAKQTQESAQELENIVFNDKKGNEKILTKEVQKQWCDIFELKNINESYIPNQSQEVKEALGGKEIKLTQGSLLKLSAKNRAQYIPQIKETLENPDFILRDTDNMLILAKRNRR